MFLNQKTFVAIVLLFFFFTLFSQIPEGKEYFAVSRLVSTVDSTTTSIGVVDVTTFPSVGDFWIGDEYFTYTDKDNGTNMLLEVNRGQPFGGKDTKAVTHRSGDTVASPCSDVFSSLLNYNVTTVQDLKGAWDGAMIMVAGLSRSIPKMITWDYSFLTGYLSILRYPLFALSIGFVISFVMIVFNWIKDLIVAARQVILG